MTIPDPEKPTEPDEPVDPEERPVPESDRSTPEDYEVADPDPEAELDQTDLNGDPEELYPHQGESEERA